MKHTKCLVSERSSTSTFKLLYFRKERNLSKISRKITHRDEKRNFGTRRKEKHRKDRKEAHQELLSVSSVRTCSVDITKISMTCISQLIFQLNLLIFSQKENLPEGVEGLQSALRRARTFIGNRTGSAQGELAGCQNLSEIIGTWRL